MKSLMVLFGAIAMGAAATIGAATLAHAENDYSSREHRYNQRQERHQNQVDAQSAREVQVIQSRRLEWYVRSLQTASGERVVAKSCRDHAYEYAWDKTIKAVEPASCTFTLQNGQLCRQYDSDTFIRPETCLPFLSGPACGKIKFAGNNFYLRCLSENGLAQDYTLHYTLTVDRALNPEDVHYYY